ncbi:MAG TPA: hypothetical protein VGV15_05455, partial [Terriglobales bacterium]|nr:hypothetical protein [Terriglobales bacterium]
DEDFAATFGRHPHCAKQSREEMAKDHKEKRKKRLKAIAFAAFLLSLSAAGWFLIALLADLMNPSLIFISFASFVPPIALSLIMYCFVGTWRKKLRPSLRSVNKNVKKKRSNAGEILWPL